MSHDQSDGKTGLHTAFGLMLEAGQVVLDGLILTTGFGLLVLGAPAAPPRAAPLAPLVMTCDHDCIETSLLVAGL